MATTEGTIEQETAQTHEDGQEGATTTNWEEEYKKLQSDYTRKSQRLAELEKQPQQDPNSDPEQIKSYLKDLGFVSKEEIEREKQLNALIEYNPDLKKHAKAIETLAKAEGKAYEDIVEEYGFGTKDAIAKAKARGPIGDRPLETKTKSYKDLTPAEREALRKDRKKDSLTAGKTLS